MATTYITQQENAKYSKNLLPAFAQFDQDITWNIVTGGSNAVVENSTQNPYSGDRGLLVTFTGTGGITFNFADGFTFTAPQDGTYIVCMRALIPSTYSAATINHRIYGYINGVNNSDIEFNVDNTAEGFVYDEYNTFYQVFQMEAGDVFDCDLKAQSDTIGSKIFLDGFKIELDDRGLSVPSRYTGAELSVQEQIGTGWASYSDTAHTSGSPLVINEGITSTITNNAGTVIEDYLPFGVTSFYDQSTSKLTPENVGDYYSFSIRFKAKNSNVAGFFDFGIDIGGSLGIIFKETQLFLKGANTEQAFSITCNGYALDTFVANGGIVKIHSLLGNTSIYDIQYQVNRTYKAQ